MGSTAVEVGDSSKVDKTEGVGLWTWYPARGSTWTTETNLGWVVAGVVDMTEVAQVP
jgi:hypothetical protein